MQKLIPLFLALVVCTSINAHKTVLRIYSYLDHPPYKTRNGGLVSGFSSLLQDRFPDFDVKVIWTSKERVKRAFFKDRATIIPFVSPTWFKDSYTTNAKWSQDIITEDNYIISSHQDKIEVSDFQGPTTNKDLSFAGVEGYYYMNVDTIVKKNSIPRVNCNNIRHCLMMITRGRAKTMVMPQAIYKVYKNDPEFIGKIYRSQKSINSYSRKVVLLSFKPRLQKTLTEFINQLNSNESWKKMIKEYK